VAPRSRVAVGRRLRCEAPLTGEERPGTLRAAPTAGGRHGSNAHDQIVDQAALLSSFFPRQPAGVGVVRPRATAERPATRPDGGVSGPSRAALKTYRKFAHAGKSAANRRPRHERCVVSHGNPSHGRVPNAQIISSAWLVPRCNAPYGGSQPSMPPPGTDTSGRLSCLRMNNANATAA
jgi:hypothetical protein